MLHSGHKQKTAGNKPHNKHNKKQHKKTHTQQKRKQTTALLSPKPIILPDHVPYQGEEPTLMPDLRKRHQKQIDALQETMQAKRFMQWLVDQNETPAAQHQTSEAMEQMREAGLNSNDAVDLLRAGMMTFLTHVESRASSATNQGFYTIGPCGEELMGALALSLREHDGVALHYRHLAVQILRQLRAGRSDEEVLLDRARGHCVSVNDPVTGGGHCAIGGGDYDFLVTSTLASQSSPAVGRAMGASMVQWVKKGAPEIPVLFPPDAVNLVSLGDGSINNGHFLSAVNLAEYAKFRKFSCPVVFCITDNDISISLRGFGYLQKQYLDKLQMPIYKADAKDALSILTSSRDAIEFARKHQQPVCLYINNITRRFGHSSADRQIAYMSAKEIQDKYDTNPLESLSTLLHNSGTMSYVDQHKLFTDLWEKTQKAFDMAVQEPKITSRTEMLSRASLPLAPVPPGAAMAGDVAVDTTLQAETAKPDHVGVPTPSHHVTKANETKHAKNVFSRVVADRKDFNNIQTRVHHRLHTPRHLEGDLAAPPAGKDVLRKHMTRTFTELMTQYPQMVYLGEDCCHGGYYLVTEGMAQKFPGRIRDFPPDETSLVGAAMGFAQNGLIPVCEIPYIKYLDCAMDMFSEAAVMSWLSNRKQPNGMIFRAQGIGRGVFGGNYHTTNLIYTLPGLDVLCWSNGPDYARGMRYAMLQAANGRVVMSIDYTALLNQRHVDDADGDDSWRKPFTKSDELLDFEQVMVYGNKKTKASEVTGVEGQKKNKDKRLAIVTYGEGVPLSLKARQDIYAKNDGKDVDIDVIDCPLLNRVPNGLKDVIGEYGSVVFADPCKDGLQPLANHAVLLQRDQLLPQSWSAAGAQPTYNPLGNTVTFLSTQDIADEVFKLQPTLKF